MNTISEPGELAGGDRAGAGAVHGAEEQRLDVF